MKRLFVLFSALFLLTVAVTACSGSEETQLGEADNEEEFSYVDESDAPELPMEDTDAERQQNEIAADPEIVTAEIPVARQIDVPQEKPVEKQKADTAAPQSTPQATPVPADEPQEDPPAREAAPVREAAANQGLMMWSVQIGAFKDDSGAMSFIQDAKTKLNQPLYKDYDPVTGFFKVTVGSFTTQARASAYKLDLRTAGFPDAFTVEVRR